MDIFLGAGDLKSFNEVRKKWSRKRNVQIFMKVKGAPEDLKPMLKKPQTKRGNWRWKGDQRDRISIACKYFEDYLSTHKKGSHKRTNEGFLTITCDPSKYRSRAHAWNEFKKMGNRIRIALERAGVQDYLKIVESTEEGYPHFHYVLLFEEDYPVKPHKEKKLGRTVYLLPNELRKRIGEAIGLTYNEKGRLEVYKDDKGKIHPLNGPGWIDLKGVMSVRELRRYLMKDVGKTVKEGSLSWKSELTISFLVYNNMNFLSHSKPITDLIKVYKDSTRTQQEKENDDQILRGNYVFIGSFSVKLIEDLQEGYDFFHDIWKYEGFDPPRWLLEGLICAIRERKPGKDIPKELLDYFQGKEDITIEDHFGWIIEGQDPSLEKFGLCMVSS